MRRARGALSAYELPLAWIAGMNPAMTGWVWGEPGAATHDAALKWPGATGRAGSARKRANGQGDDGVNNRILTIGGLVLLLAGVIGAAVYILMRTSSAEGTATLSVEEVLAPKPYDIGMGDPNAPIKMIEYASTGCPHCAAMALQTIPKLKEAYIDTGKVYYVLRDFPLDNVALGASMIARCLPADKFYAFMDVLFANQAMWHSPTVADPREALIELSRRAGLSREQVDACLKDQKKLDEINESLTHASDVLKVQGTPTSFINGEMIDHAMPFEELDAKLKTLLPK